jgi:GTP pyrophosphokinase
MENVKERYEKRATYAEELKPVLYEILTDAGIKPISIDSRAKRYYSLYRKLMRNDMDLDKIYDLVAVRVIVQTIEECYAVLGIIHKHWSPLPTRFKDFIAVPKPNGYRSLHTTVSAVDNKITEIQIKTMEMHQENEFGIAAHWVYEQIKKDPTKESRKWGGVQNKKELLWVQQLQNWQNKFINQNDFLESLKVDFFKERIFVLTPKNDVIDLPSGSTPVDFAYHIHSDIGDQCTGAKVNGKIVPLEYELHSGDVVDILTQKGKKPSEDWLRFIKSSMAKKYVKSALHTKDKKLQSKISAPKEIQLRIMNLDRSGYLKEVTGAFGDLDINIIFLNSQTDPRATFSLVTIRCENVPKQKLEKLIVRLKRIEGTKEITYHYI